MSKEIVLREYMDGSADHYNGITFDELVTMTEDMTQGNDNIARMSRKLGVNRKRMYVILDKLFKERVKP